MHDVVNRLKFLYKSVGVMTVVDSFWLLRDSVICQTPLIPCVLIIMKINNNNNNNNHHHYHGRAASVSIIAVIASAAATNQQSY